MSKNNFFRNQYIAFIANKINVEVHRHSTFQMVISLDNVFNSNIKQEAIEDIEIILFNQFVPHSCFTKDSKVLVYLVEPDSYLGALIKFFLQKKDYLVLVPSPFTSSIKKDAIENSFSDNLFIDKLLISILNTNHSLGELIDDRIKSAIDLIKININQNLELIDIAEKVCLSESRFRHFFIEQTGIPFSKYVLWTRIKKVFVETMQNKMSFTAAALASGFSDQAHFNNIFKRTFGISPKALSKNSRFIQVYI